ncbi:Hypothetical protein D9617_19g102650 [Elsinoe fawcettii]|nr:Hypothetical protein D9617_19g102650 [Elsinoe fawcettii]
MAIYVLAVALWLMVLSHGRARYGATFAQACLSIGTDMAEVAPLIDPTFTLRRKSSRRLAWLDALTFVLFASSGAEQYIAYSFLDGYNAWELPGEPPPESQKAGLWAITLLALGYSNGFSHLVLSIAGCVTARREARKRRAEREESDSSDAMTTT